MSNKGAKFGHHEEDDEDDDEEEGDYEEEYYGDDDYAEPAAAQPAGFVEVAQPAAAAGTAVPMDALVAKAVAQFTSAFQTMAQVSLKQIAPARPSFTNKTSELTKIFIDYKVRDTVHNLATRSKGVLSIKPGVTARLRFENPAVAESLKSGKELAVLIKASHKGTLSTDVAHEYTYKGLPGTPTVAVGETELRAGNCAFEHVLVEKPFDDDLRAFIKENGRYHGKNFASCYTLIPNTNMAMLHPAPSPLASLWAKLGGPDGKPVESTPVKGGFKLVEVDANFKEACEMTQLALEEHLAMFDPYSFEMLVQTISAVDSRGNPIAMAFGQPNDVVSFAGTVELTCAICESIQATKN
jgi:hypothetical protein